MKKRILTELRQTCPGCPAQWEGRTKDGKFVYIRFRYGSLEMGIAGTEEGAIRDREYCINNPNKREDPRYDGFLDEKTMMEKLNLKLIEKKNKNAKQ